MELLNGLIKKELIVLKDICRLQIFFLYYLKIVYGQ